MNEMRKVLQTYGAIVFDSNSDVWGLWCSSQGGFYITYSTMEAMYMDVRKVMLSESDRVSRGE